MVRISHGFDCLLQQVFAKHLLCARLSLIDTVVTKTESISAVMEIILTGKPDVT